MKTLKIYLKETDGSWKLYDGEIQAELDKRNIVIAAEGSSIGARSSIGEGSPTQIKHAALASEDATTQVPRYDSNQVGNAQAAVEKFNKAFPTFAINCPDRSALAVMKKYAAIMGHSDLANELEYHLAKPADEAIGELVKI